MKIEPVRTYKKIKGIYYTGLCLSEEYGLMVGYQDDFRTVAAYSFETGEKVWTHKFGRYFNIFSIRRIGKWVFVEVHDCGASCHQWLSLNLQTLEFSLWHEGGIPPFEGVGDSYVIGSRIVFIMSKPWDASVKPRCVSFDVESGCVVECPEIAARWRGAFAVTSQYAIRHDALPEGGGRVRLYGVDAEGIPTEEVSATLEDSNVEYCGHLDDRIYGFLRRADLTAIAIARYSLEGMRIAEMSFPELKAGVSDDGIIMHAEAVMVNVSGMDRLLVFRRGSHGGGKILQYMLFDPELKELVWSRSFAAFDANGASLTAAAILHPNGNDRVNLTDLATGHGAECDLNHYHLHCLDGVSLPFTDGGKFDCRGIGDHLFWMGNPSRALTYGKVVF